ncbi:choline/glycine/proline betaine transport protein [Mycoplana sp. BE70]|uniref:BCCT family transporter n=1 Tax=Mycoplana sp. BE70 TaxID=2817775 RepID=UPI00285C98B1|nr:BCCT family transporter [Mycoplana sp. BE70]MDR6756949.1 choline/glycine/proline betaine transport protein [Mycoplana sp. BE70]
MKQPLTGISPISFYGSAIISLGLILFASIFPEVAAALFKRANDWIIAELGWFYMLAVGGFVIFLLFLAISPLGRVKLGPDEAEPDYSYSTWVAMLFSAGMGIGIVFYGVAEPIMHFSAPPDAEPRTAQAARDAMEVTFFHWGVHAWAIYAVMGLALAYFGYRKDEPLVIRSAFRPLLGDRINGPLGDVIDIFAVVGTLAGLATSLGLGVAQLNATGTYLFGLAQNLETQLVLIAIVTGLATVTVATGLDNGIRRLSEMIIIVSFILMFLILVLGPTRFLLQAFVENIGLYLNGFVARTFHIYAYEPTEWLGSWTLFYWGWWISWSPFVGLFIARISRGRTIRQFLLGVLFAPAGFSFIWFTVFGDVAIWLDRNVADGQITRTVTENMPIALFTVFEYLPWSTFLAWLTGLLVAVYFVTASDAGALVIAMITSQGDEEPVLWLRVFWSLVCGGVAACLLLAGGLDAVQMAAVIAALPLSVLMVLMCYGIWKALSDEVALTTSASLPAAPMVPHEAAKFWRRRISAIIDHPGRPQVERFIASTVAKAFETVARELEKPEDIEADVEKTEDGLRFVISHGETVPPFVYEVRPVSKPIPAFVVIDAARNEGGRNRYYRAEVFLAQGSRGYDIYGYDLDQVIADVVNHYGRYRHYLAITG